MKTIFLLLSFIFLFNSCGKSQDTIESLSPGMHLQKTLNKGQVHEYNISLDKNGYFEFTVLQKGVDAVVNILDAENKILRSFDTPIGANGPEKINFIPGADGVYKISIFPFTGIGDPMVSDSTRIILEETNFGDYEIDSISFLSSAEYQKKLEAIRMEAQNIIASLKDYTHPLTSVTPGSGFKDLDFLKAVLKDVKYVGLGEATHGTKEFFQMKARMLEFLVKKMGFTVFAIEASYAGCNNINEYVLHGTGNAYTALTTQGFWTWNTEEVIAMIEWMRNYNKSVPEIKKVKFMGFDIQVNSLGGGFDVVQNYLKKVDTLRASQSDSLFKTFRRMDRMDTKDLNLDSLKKEYFTLLGFMEMSKGHYIQRSSPEEYEKAMQHLRAIGQLYDAYFMNPRDVRNNEREWRDYYMASNFMYLVQREEPGTKFVLWAHNVHIKKNNDGSVNGGSRPFGSYLKDAFGNNYYAFGFSFSKGSFQSMESTMENNYLGLQEFTVEPAKINSLDWYFAQTGYPKFIINFRGIKLPDNLIEFTNTDLLTRSAGAVAVRTYVETYYDNININKDFDGMIFIDNTTRSVPTPTGVRK